MLDLDTLPTFAHSAVTALQAAGFTFYSTPADQATVDIAPGRDRIRAVNVGGPAHPHGYPVASISQCWLEIVTAATVSHLEGSDLHDSEGYPVRQPVMGSRVVGLRAPEGMDIDQMLATLRAHGVE